MILASSQVVPKVHMLGCPSVPTVVVSFNVQTVLWWSVDWYFAARSLRGSTCLRAVGYVVSHIPIDSVYRRRPDV